MDKKQKIAIYNLLGYIAWLLAIVSCVLIISLSKCDNINTICKNKIKTYKEQITDCKKENKLLNLIEK